MQTNHDKNLISLDFLGECADMLVTAGAAITAAAAAERLDVIELALRQARNTLIEMITEFKSIHPES
jgi:hypothetical protein